MIGKLLCAALSVALPAYALNVSAQTPVAADANMAGTPAANDKTCEPQQPLPPIPPTAAPNSTWLAKGKEIPPKYRQGKVGFRIEFRSAEEINRICASQPSGLPICGIHFYACVHGDTMFMPNPCDTSTDDNTYAGTLCHEAAHGRGWPDTHGD